jgi:energy-coupling factor transport system ATP-binding protein
LPETVVEAQDVWFWYHRDSADSPVLRGVNLKVEQGEFTALIGANGSGKTTLVKQFNGLLRPTRGSVLVDGMSTAGRSVGELAGQVGYLFQHPEQQIFSSTVREEIAFGPRNLGLAPPAVESRVDTALARFGLVAAAEQPPSVLGYGLRRRITLASLAAMDPPILILDEPTVGLDAAGRAETLNWLGELQTQGRTILLVSHDMSLVAGYADRVVILRQGTVIADGLPGTVFQQTDLLESASLSPPPILTLAQALRRQGLRGDNLTVDAFADEYLAHVRDRALPKPASRVDFQAVSGSQPPPGGEVRAERSEGHRGSSPSAASEGQPYTAAASAASGGVDFYVPRDSWLHRMDPRAKLWAVLLAAIVAMMFKQLAVLAALLSLSHLAILSARIPVSRLRWLWARLAPLLIMILILQPWFSPGPGPALIELGPLRLTWAGISIGLSFALRTATLAFIISVLLLTTDPTKLVQGLTKLGLPYSWGLTVGLALHHLPTTFALFTAIHEAQQARGWIAGRGSFLTRARSYLPIMVATIIAALRLSDRLGLALAARGFGYPARRSTLHSLTFRTRDWLAVLMAAALFAAMLVFRYVLGFGAEAW